MKQGHKPAGRRAFAQWALAGAAALVLSACGGSDSDDGLDRQGVLNLEGAYNAVGSGMSKAQVIGIVGEPPHQESDFMLGWSDYSYGSTQGLTVRFHTVGGQLVTDSASWFVQANGTVSRSLNKNL